jgi:hypothetical protein
VEGGKKVMIARRVSARGTTHHSKKEEEEETPKAKMPADRHI